MTEEAQYVFFFTIIVVNVIFFCAWIFKFVQTLKTMFKQNYENLYVCLFLCCRRDKLIKDEAKLAREAKRETIIEKIEDIQFFITHMKAIYSKEVFYEGHDKFINLLYYIENQRQNIDLTVKRHNLYIQGKMARDRKFDPDRMKELNEVDSLSVDEEFGGETKRGMKSLKSFRSMRSKADMAEKAKLIGSAFEMKAKEPNKIGQIKAGGGMFELRDESGPVMLETAQLGGAPAQVDRSMNSSSPMLDLQEQLQKMQKDKDKEKARTLMKDLSKKIAGAGLESDASDQEDADGNKTKKKLKTYKRPNVADIGDVVKKSRNAKAKINYEHKSRIFAQDLQNPNQVKQYMMDYFKDFKPEEDTPSDNDSDELSPDKSELFSSSADPRSGEASGTGQPEPSATATAGQAGKFGAQTSIVDFGRLGEDGKVAINMDALL
jgi:hypothetical protein